MILVFSDHELPTKVQKTIFLAGPTKRLMPGNIIERSWRHQALLNLEDAGFDGHVFIPIPESHFREGSIAEETISYEDQIAWEMNALHRADIILFYVERTPDNLGLTTNVEFGMFASSGRVIYSRPDNAMNIRYLDKCAERNNLTIYSEMEPAIECALSRIGEGAQREGLECIFPYLYWTAPQFQHWYISHINQKNEIRGFEVKSAVVLNNGLELFGYSAWVSIWISDEQRIKDCEWVFSRATTTYVVPYYVNHNGTRSYVLVRDFRSTSVNGKGYVYEVPGGKHEEHLDALDNAAKELEEEIGLPATSTRDRLVPLGCHQPYAVFSPAIVIAYCIELTANELKQLKLCVETGTVLGSDEDDEENIRLAIMHERSISAAQRNEDFPVDLFTLGLIRLSDAVCPRNKAALPKPTYPPTARI